MSPRSPVVKTRTSVRSPLYMSFRFGRYLAPHHTKCARALLVFSMQLSRLLYTKHNEPALGQNTRQGFLKKLIVRCQSLKITIMSPIFNFLVQFCRLAQSKTIGIFIFFFDRNFRSGGSLYQKRLKNGLFKKLKKINKKLVIITFLYFYRIERFK